MGGEEDPTVVSWGTADQAVGVTVGEGHACLWQADGALYCWGWNDFGQLGVGTRTLATYPVEVDLPAIEGASAGGSLTCAVLPGGEVVCWGFQVGDPMGMIHEDPFPVPGLPAIADVATGDEHGCVRARGGGAWCWGTSTYGQLGNGAYRGEPAPVPVEL
jgi:alpha-tubulin suppressor-like RCC1 family protein